MNNESITIDFTKSLSQRVIDYLGQVPGGRATAWGIAAAVNPTEDGKVDLPPVSKAIFSHIRQGGNRKIQRVGLIETEDGKERHAYELTEEGWRHVGAPGHGKGVRRKKWKSESREADRRLTDLSNAELHGRNTQSTGISSFRKYLEEMERQEQRSKMLEQQLRQVMGTLRAHDPELFRRIIGDGAPIDPK